MKTYALESPVVGGSEDYSEDYPTRQTELLSLECRRILDGLTGAGFALIQRELGDEKGLNPPLYDLNATLSGLDLNFDATSVVLAIEDLRTAVSGLSDKVSLGLTSPSDVVGMLDDVKNALVDAIDDLRHDLLVVGTKPHAVHVYDKIVYTEDGMVEEE